MEVRKAREENFSREKKRKRNEEEKDSIGQTLKLLTNKRKQGKRGKERDKS